MNLVMLACLHIAVGQSRELLQQVDQVMIIATFRVFLLYMM